MSTGSENRSGVGFLLGEGFRNFKDNKLMSFATIGILTACMLLIGMSILFGINVQSVMNYIQDLNEVVVFLNDDVTEEEALQLKSVFAQNDNILSIEYISKEEALEGQLDAMGENSDLFAGLLGDDNPLPSSFNIKIEDLSRLKETVTMLDNTDGVYYTKAPTDIANTLVDIRKAVNVISVIIVGILVMVSIIIINNTIKMTIFARSKEINIMKYVGASDFFIRVPFLIEGVVIGLISAVISYILLWGGYKYIYNWLISSESSWIQLVSDNIVPFSSVMAYFIPGFLGFGLLFGIFGNLLFLGKHLKV